MLVPSLLREQRTQNPCLGGLYNWNSNTVFSAEGWRRDKHETGAVGIPESCPTWVFRVVLNKAVTGFLLLVHLWKMGRSYLRSLWSSSISPLLWIFNYYKLFLNPIRRLCSLQLVCGENWRRCFRTGFLPVTDQQDQEHNPLPWDNL